MRSINDYMSMIEAAEAGDYDSIKPEDGKQFNETHDIEYVEKNVISGDGYSGHIQKVLSYKEDDIFYMVEIVDSKGNHVDNLRIYHYLPKAEPYEHLKEAAIKKFNSWLSKEQAQNEQNTESKTYVENDNSKSKKTYNNRYDVKSYVKLMHEFESLTSTQQVHLQEAVEYMGEAIYDEMIGIMELSQFMKVASDVKIKEFKEKLKNNEYNEAWKIITSVLDIEENNEN